MRNARYLFPALILTALQFAPPPASAKKYVVKIPVSVYSGGRVIQNSDSIPVVSARGEMQVKVGDISHDTPELPSQSLSAALKHDKSSRKFRISWTSVGSDYTLSVTALYDRKLKTIKYYRFDAGGRDEYYSEYHHAALVTGVMDTMIHRVGNYNYDNPGNPGGIGEIDVQTGGLTRFLTRYGARIAWSKNRKIKT